MFSKFSSPSDIMGSLASSIVLHVLINNAFRLPQKSTPTLAYFQDVPDKYLLQESLDWFWCPESRCFKPGFTSDYRQTAVPFRVPKNQIKIEKPERNLHGKSSSWSMEKWGQCFSAGLVIHKYVMKVKGSAYIDLVFIWHSFWILPYIILYNPHNSSVIQGFKYWGHGFREKRHVSYS